jgi:hypothetical protein
MEAGEAETGESRGTACRAHLTESREMGDGRWEGQTSPPHKMGETSAATLTANLNRKLRPV